MEKIIGREAEFGKLADYMESGKSEFLHCMVDVVLARPSYFGVSLRISLTFVLLGSLTIRGSGNGGFPQCVGAIWLQRI